MTLDAELRAFYDARQQQIPAEVREVMRRAGVELAASGQAGRAPAAGAWAPPFALPSATGETVTLDRILAQGPVVLTFYRGAWCPYCNIALRSLQQHHVGITERGARLVAVSPQIPDESLSLAEKHALDFTVLSDVGSDTAKAYGLAFDLPDALAAVYDSSASTSTASTAATRAPSRSPRRTSSTRPAPSAGRSPTPTTPSAPNRPTSSPRLTPCAEAPSVRKPPGFG